MTPLDRLEWLAAVAAERSLWGAPVAVAGALAYLASEGKCHPGLALLVQETGLHKATCARVLAKLERAGFVGKQKRQGRGRATEYTLKLSHANATVSEPKVNGKTVAQTVAQTVAPRCDTEWGSGVKDLTTSARAAGMVRREAVAKHVKREIPTRGPQATPLGARGQISGGNHK